MIGERLEKSGDCLVGLCSCFDEFHRVAQPALWPDLLLGWTEKLAATLVQVVASDEQAAPEESAE